MGPQSSLSSVLDSPAPTISNEEVELSFSPRQSEPSIWLILKLATWFGLVTGLVEGAGLLLFQRINWKDWGLSVHVSAEILWIAPICDFLLFLLLGLGLGLVAYLAPRLRSPRFGVFLFSLLMFYDWFALPERLWRIAALVLAFGGAKLLTGVFKKHDAAFLRFWRTTLPWATAAFLLTWAAIQGTAWIKEKVALAKLPAAQPGAPNVVVIVMDTVRADHLSTYGYERPTTPHIDHIAEQGVLFENAISASSWTLPSHASMLTGRYSYEHRATDVKPETGKTLDGRYPTLPEILAEHGYRTGGFSANSVYFNKNLGLERGFIHFEDYFHSAFDSFSRTVYGQQLARSVFSWDGVRRLAIWLGFPSIDELQTTSSKSWAVRKRASDVNREAFSWIDRDPKKPFFVFMNYFGAHRPYTRPPYGVKRFVQLDNHALYLQQVNPTAEERSAGYDECIAHIDDAVKSFLDGLKQRGLDQHTLLVITSDHGELLGEHGLYEHQNSLYLPLIRVPLIFWQPGHVPAGVRIPTAVSNVSIAATVTDMLGLNHRFPGPPLSIFWKAQSRPTSWPEPVSELTQFNYASPDWPSHYGAMTSLITPQYHYILHQQSGASLYDWVHDPSESVNLAKTPQGEQLVSEFAAQVQSQLAHPR